MDKLLQNIANKYTVSFNVNNPFPLEFESIANQILAQDNRKSKDVYSELKGEIARMVCGQIPVNDSLHELFVRDIPLDCILTTNYDYMLERAFYGDSQPAPKLKIIARQNIASSDLQNMQKRVFIISTEKQIIGNHCASDMSIMLHILQKCENT